MDHDQLREVAMITDEIKYKKDQVLFNTDEKADACFLLMEGSVDLHYVVDEHDPSLRKEFIVGTINPGELLGISAFVEPQCFFERRKPWRELDDFCFGLCKQV